MHIPPFLPLSLTMISLIGCAEVLSGTADFHTNLPDTGTFASIPLLPTGDAALIQSFDSGVPSDISSDNTDPITGSRSYTIEEVTRFQVFGGTPTGGQDWLPNRRQTVKFRSGPFSKNRINASASKFNYRYQSRQTVAPVVPNVPITNDITYSVSSTPSTFTQNVKVTSEAADSFPDPNLTVGPNDLLNASFYDEGGPCLRIRLRLIRGLLDSRWSGDPRDIYISAPIGEILNFSLTSLASSVVAQVKGSGLVDMGETLTDNSWNSICTNPAQSTDSVTIGGNILDSNGVDLNLSDYVFADSAVLGLISVSAEQGVTIVSYINAPGENYSNDDFALTGVRPHSSIDDIKVKVNNP